jgi:periplasmic protein TonB
MIGSSPYLETPRERLLRWSTASLGACGLYAAAALALFWSWPDTPPPQQTGGAILIEMSEMTMETPSEGENTADAPELEGVEAEVPPVEEQAEPAPEEPPPVAEDLPSAEEDLPQVEETPAVPEPEVVLPDKQEQTEPAEKPAEKPLEKPPEKPVEKTAEKPRPAPSPRQQQQQAASAPQGKTNPASSTPAALNAPGFNPNPVVRSKPVYPPGARSRRQEGHVVVSYSVSPDGNVSAVSVVSASPPGIFEAATLAAVRKWRFRESAQGASNRRTTIHFKLK